MHPMRGNGRPATRLITSLASVIIASAACWPVGALAAQPVEVSVKITPVPFDDFAYGSGKIVAGGAGPRGTCPAITVTHSSIPFDNLQNASVIIEGGFVEQEIAAQTYTPTPAEFPVTVRTMEKLFVQNFSTVTTTTHWSVLVWAGAPSDSNPPVFEVSSDGKTIPHIVIPPSAQPSGVLVSLTVDPGDPEQIVVPFGSTSFSVGFRIDQHNQPATSSCCAGFIPQPCCPAGDPPCDGMTIGNNNAFPTVDANGLQFPSQNWLRCRDGCGPLACSGGWHTTGSLGLSGDWNIRTIYEPFDCPGLGGCCLATSCQIVSSANCSSMGGVYRGDGSSCSTCTGACCREDGTCTESTNVSQCQGINEVFHLDLTCAQVPGGCPQPPGGCCISDAPGCVFVTEADCQIEFGGSWLGPLTECGAGACDGACCSTTSSFCFVDSQQDCSTLGGQFQGYGTECIGPSSNVCPTGGCCLFDGSCQVLRPLECEAMDGVYQGDGAECSPNPCPQPTGACCLTSGGCALFEQSPCVGLGHTWAGPGTDCTDANMNGTADDCESGCPDAPTGDINGDLDADGLDVAAFAAAVMGTPTGAEICAGDFDDDGDLGTGDVPGFVAALLAAP